MISLETESWVWYGIVVTLVFLRYVSRYLHLGSIKKFQAEDYLMVFVVVCYTFLIVYLNIVNTLPSNLIPPDQIDTLQPSTIPQRIYGSKLVIVVEQFWCATVWSCKICLLLLYSQLTTASRQAILVKIVGAYVVFGYCVMELLFYTTWCRPFHNYWSVPAANPQCSTYHDHLIVNTVFNVSSDVMMLCIPLPILIRAKLPLRKKLILCVVFSMGIFVIICAVLSKFYSFSRPYGVDWVYWYVREVSTAVIVANMPHLWALMRRTFNLRAFLSHSGSALRTRLATNGSRPETMPHHHAGTASSATTATTDDRKWYGLRSGGGGRDNDPDSFLDHSESEEHITGVPLEIRKDVEFRVEHHNRIIGRGGLMDRDLAYAETGRLGPPSGLRTGWQSKSTIASTSSAV